MALLGVEDGIQVKRSLLESAPDSITLTTQAIKIDTMCDEVSSSALRGRGSKVLMARKRGAESGGGNSRILDISSRTNGKDFDAGWSEGTQERSSGKVVR